MSVPYTFATATSSIPLSQLDSNFATAITLGNTAVYLGNTTTTLGNLTLNNVTVSSGNVTVTNATVNALTSGRVTYAGTSGLLKDSANLTFDGTSLTLGGNPTISSGTANGVAYLNGSKVLTTGSALVFDGTNLGIGTSSPRSVSGFSNIGINGSSGSFVDLFVSGTRQSTFSVDSSNNVQIENVSAGPILFTINSSERMRLDSSGNLLVGTTSAIGRFTVNGSGTSSAAYSLVSNDSASSTLFAVRNDGAIQMPKVQNFTSASAANIYYDGAYLYKSTSSLKYKKNVQDTTHGLVDVLKLRPVTYEGKSETDAGKTFGGLIAEEVHEAGLTEFVQYAEDGTPDALAYGNMVSLCIKAIQEQQTMIEQLKAEVAALKGA